MLQRQAFRNPFLHKLKPLSVMSIILSYAFLGTGLSQRAIAQDEGVCFMVGAGGRATDLGKLCRQESAPPSGIYRVPILRRMSGIPVIPVQFNDGQSFEMLLDSGASGTLITQDMAQRLGVRSVGQAQGTVADGSVVTLSVGYIQSINVGGATLKQVPVAIAPRMTIGLLGQDFLSRYTVSIGQSQVEFRPH